MLNKFSRHLIELHIIQSFPVSCLNRDDNGSPKTAVVGGVNRARVSSQCWKRQVRTEMHNFGVNLGKRTRNIDVLLINAMVALGADETDAEKSAKVITDAIGANTLVFISDKEIQALAGFAQGKNFKVEKIASKDIVKLLGVVADPNLDAIDIALFGRMVASINDLNIEGACGFNHAISTHKVDNDLDYFTALDDSPNEDEEGSAHLGINEFNSATYYRYVSINLGQLVETLFGDNDVDVETLNLAIKTFIHALYVAVPSARQNTQSASSAWDFAKVYVRKGQRIQANIDKPVTLKSTDQGGYSEKSIAQLNEHLSTKEKLSGSLFGKIAEFNFGIDTEFSIDDLVEGIQAEVVKING